MNMDLDGSYSSNKHIVWFCVHLFLDILFVCCNNKSIHLYVAVS